MSIFGPLSGGTPATPAADSYSDLASRIEKQSEDRRAYFDKLAEQLKGKRYGPSASERLLAISGALAAPTRTPGFGGLMSNVVPVFQQYEKDKRAAEEARASDMEKLTLGRIGMGDSEIKTALELQKLRAQYLAAGRPDIQLDQQGNIREVPKIVYRPTTDAEYAAIPIGAFYVVPSGPEAGRIIPK